MSSGKRETDDDGGTEEFMNARRLYSLADEDYVDTVKAHDRIDAYIVCNEVYVEYL